MKITITILLFFWGASSLGQSPEREKVYEILRFANIFNSPYRETAKRAFEDYISKDKTNPYRLPAMFWLAEILNKLNKIDSAALLYTQVLYMSVPDSIDDRNFRYSSAKRLAEIYINRSNYCTALNYLDLAKLKFIPRFYCGTARMEDGLNMKTLYSACYNGQGDFKKTIDTLSPYIFYLSDRNSMSIDYLYKAYLQSHTKEEIKDEFLNIEKNLVIKKIQYSSFSYPQPTVKIFGDEIGFQVHKYNLNSLTEQEQKEKCMEKITQSAIYKFFTATNVPAYAPLQTTDLVFNQPQKK